jgi:group II intron reverse transcriptase/maturase
MLEEILDRRNIERALVQVERNKGAAGVDEMQWAALRPYVNGNWQGLRMNILEGKYAPECVRKVEIDKPQGGKRALGIPTVVDRMLGQAIAQWLGYRYDNSFSKRSYGFRPNCNAHQAVLQTHQYLKEGKEWVIELDLENFFDKINHDRLMSVLARRITDKRILKLIRSYLTSGIMEGGVISPRSEGSPQGSPLSPILSNIVLDELDKELEKRGLAFVRYADDVSIYVKSETAAKRIKAGITAYIEQKLLLKVNHEKTKISRPEESNLLGFSFRKPKEKEWTIVIARKSVERVIKRCKEITKRNSPLSEEERIGRLNKMLVGWVNYFVIAKDYTALSRLDGNIRMRLRMCLWKQWKNAKARRRNLLKLGIDRSTASGYSHTYKGYHRIAISRSVSAALSIEYFSLKGYIGFRHYQYLRTGLQKSLF